MVWLMWMRERVSAGVCVSHCVSPVQALRAAPWDAAPGRVPAQGPRDSHHALPAGNKGRGAGRAEMFPDSREEGMRHTGVARERVFLPCDIFTVVLSSLGWFLCPGGMP